MYREGECIIDKLSGRTGYVLRVYSDGVTARFGGMTAIRTFSDIEPAPIELQQEDLLTLQHLAVETGDKEWFMEIGQKMGVQVHG
jgi:hypothetical protein